MFNAISTSLVPSTVFTSMSLPPGDQFDAWRERISVVFNVEPLETSFHDGFPAEALAYHLGELILVRTHFEAQRFVRTRLHARSDQLDHYLVQFYNQGGYTGAVGEKPIEIRPGSLSILDLARTTETRATAAECVTLVVPRDLMHEVLPRSANLHGVVLDPGNGRLFSTYLISLLRQLPATEARQAPLIVAATLDLLAACLLPTLDQLGASSKLSDVMRFRDVRKRMQRVWQASLRSAGSVTPQENFDDWVRALRA
jgi:hypothetical protein